MRNHLALTRKLAEVHNETHVSAKHVSASGHELVKVQPWPPLRNLLVDMVIMVAHEKSVPQAKVSDESSVKTGSCGSFTRFQKSVASIWTRSMIVVANWTRSFYGSKLHAEESGQLLWLSMPFGSLSNVSDKRSFSFDLSIWFS
jgi:hypothetical protein